MKKFFGVLSMAAVGIISAIPAHAAGIADVIDAVDLAGIETAIVALFVTAVGIRLVYTGYKFVKSALGRA